MIDFIAKKTVNTIKKNINGIDQDKAEVIEYGLSVLIYEVLLLVIVFIPSIFLHNALFVATAVLGYSILRGFAGGMHAHTRLICGSSYIFLIYASVFVGYILKEFDFVLYIWLLLLDITILLLYAPGDTKENPIKNKEKRMKKKVASIVSLIIIFAFSIIVAQNDPRLSNIFIVSSSFAVLLTTPLLYKAYRCERSY